MTLSCYIVDDHPHVIVGLTRLIKQMPGLELAGSDTEPVLALNKILTNAVKTDILFLDVDMPDLDGLDFARQLEGRASIIFVTGHSHYAAAAFDIGAADYLQKPVNPGHFARAVERARQRIVASSTSVVPQADYIFVRFTSRDIRQLALNQLQWIEASDKYIYLHVTGEKPLLVRNSLSQFEAALPAAMFVRIHKSHLVNLAYVTKLAGPRVVMKDDKILEVGPNYMDELIRRMNVV